MIILDASAVLEWLLRAKSVPKLCEALVDVEAIACPVILDLEVLNVLRRQTIAKIITMKRAEQAIELYLTLPLERYETTLLTEQIWRLRDNFTSYDASYIALSEVLNVPLYTKDKKWDGIPGHQADIRFI